MPKRPTGAYFRFQKEYLKDKMAENAEMDHHDVQRLVSEEWKALTDQEKLVSFPLSFLASISSSRRSEVSLMI